MHITVLLGISEIKIKHCLLLPLFIDNFFNIPIIQNKKKIKFKEVITCLKQDIISYFIARGKRTINDPKGITIQFQVELEKYALAVE